MTGSEVLSRRLTDARGRTEHLEERLVALEGQIEELRTDLGRAMATEAAPGTLKNIQRELREASDEMEGAERGLTFLAEERERLESDLAAAQASEAAEERDAKVAEAVTAIDELAKALAEWGTTTLLPLAEVAEARSAEAFEAERRAGALSGERSRECRAQKQGWAQHQGLAAAVGAVRRVCTPP